MPPGEEPSLKGVLVAPPGIVIPRTELEVRATRSGGPGGQHVNTSSTRVEIVWNVRSSGVLTEDQRARALAKLASRLDSTGALRIVSSETRSQRQNRELAEQRLADVVRSALTVPKKRKRTKPTYSSVQKRLEGKRHRSGKKRERRRDSDD
ncbi:MAG: aminoacyl-tRNA hydrolase [Gemmatimonadetes bacterium]|nr:aminoacyl-tRNA hydrolase [Gemmatimonadota bacterium]